MFVYFTDLNLSCLKYQYLFPNIDKMIDGSLGYKTMSFVIVYSHYNQIKMDPLDAPKIKFMYNNYNYYYYKVMPFVLKNVGTTYQRLVDAIFSS